ncbi:hypothetical protein H1R20_g6574, partial [Candolleomyces eurysporus]
MHLNVAVVQECEFAQWQLEVGRGGHTNINSGDITLLESFRCGGKIEDLIGTVYSEISNNQPLPPNQYFAEHTILSSRNDDVDSIHSQILNQVPGEGQVYHSIDSAQSQDEGDQGIEMMYPQEYLNSINFTGLPLLYSFVSRTWCIDFAEGDATIVRSTQIAVPPLYAGHLSPDGSLFMYQSTKPGLWVCDLASSSQVVPFSEDGENTIEYPSAI